MTTQLLGKNCDGGYYSCSPPKDCCKQGCCYLLTTTLQRPPTVPTANIFSPLFLGHWYFWVAIMATVIGILCACSLWRRHSHGSGATFCCRNASRDERVSEPDSNGSCYAPPQYSRCNSFHQPPPPYSEVASKPDLYPLVISYNGDSVIKTNHSTGYLMVQYFRNFIVRPVGSLSATSTIESLSSSFICNATNDANIIPPPYSCMGSLEEVTTDDRNVETPPPVPISRLPHSASSLSTELYQPVGATPSPIPPPPLPPPPTVHATPNRHISIRDNPCFGQGAKEETVSPLAEAADASCNSSPFKRILKPIPKLPKDCSQESDEDHNFSDLLNLSVCVPSSIANLCTSVQSNHHLQELHYSVTDSMTGSDISSLANLGTPDSPPRATSPTLEMKELLDKIQQLPQQKSPVPVEASSKSIGRSRAKAKTLYMPLHEKPRNANNSNNKSSTKMFPKGWLSRSAPNTPCANFTPTFPVHRKGSSQKGSRSGGVGDGSPLLKEHEESEEDANRDETL